MKKMLIVVATVAMAFAACGKKKDAAKPADTGSATMPTGTEAGSGSDAGSAAAPATP